MGHDQRDGMDKTDVLLGVATRMDEKIDRVLVAQENHEQRIQQLERRPNVGSFGFWKTAAGVIIAGLVWTAVSRLIFPESAAKAIVSKVQIGGNE